MKTKKVLSIILFLFLMIGMGACKDNEPQYKIYENHEISACGVDDPLQNIEWLREYCEILKKTHNLSSVYIHIYKVTGTDDHLFKMSISYSDFEYSPFLYSEDWRDCTGKLVFTVKSGVPPNPEVIENFMKDKEFVAELFRIVKQ